MEINSWSTGRLLNTAARLNERYENERLRSHGISLSGLTLLRVLAVQTAISQTRLADVLHIQPQTVGKAVDRLVLRGLVHRVRDDADRRVVLVELAPVGRELLAILDAEEEEFDRSTGLADQDLHAALEKVIVSLSPAGAGIRRRTAGMPVSERVPLLAPAR